MKLTDCEVFVIGNPPPRKGGRYFIVVQLTTDDGIKGVGEVYAATFGPDVVAQMVEDDRYCIDILHQIAAIRSALTKVETQVLKDHAACCVAEAIASGDAQEQRLKFEELVDLFDRGQVIRGHHHSFAIGVSLRIPIGIFFRVDFSDDVKHRFEQPEVLLQHVDL